MGIDQAPAGALYRWEATMKTTAQRIADAIQQASEYSQREAGFALAVEDCTADEVEA